MFPRQNCPCCNNWPRLETEHGYKVSLELEQSRLQEIREHCQKVTSYKEKQRLPKGGWQEWFSKLLELVGPNGTS
jgi:hypothetical protein